MPVTYQDYYKTLGVSRKATQKEINAAYRKLARKHHPDLNKSKSAEEEFKKINEAYEVLKDSDTRAKYDALGANWKQGQAFRRQPGPGGPFGAGGFRTSGGPNAAGGFDFGGFGGFSDFFESLFGGAGGGDFRQAAGPMPGQANIPRSPRQPRKPQPQESEITVSLEEAYRGAQKNVTLHTVGIGAAGQPANSKSDYSIKIPAGITDGGKIRLAGRGPDGGDITLKVRVAPHPRYRLKQHDLETDVRVAPWEAALGAKVDVPTLDGQVTITLPQGVQGGQRMRLAGKGLVMRNGQRGNLYAVIQIAVPKDLSAKERDLFEQLARESSFNPRS